MAGVVASSAHRENIAFVIGAERTVPLWRTLTATDWADATDLPGAQVAVAELSPRTGERNSSAVEFGGLRAPKIRPLGLGRRRVLTGMGGVRD